MKTIKFPLPHWGERPGNAIIDTFVIHSMYAPGTENPFDPFTSINLLDKNSVTTHYMIDRGGVIIELVPEALKAWHAGKSRMPFVNDSREEVNDFSIGVELNASETSGFTDLQYISLIDLILDVSKRHPINAIVGHDQIAPGRKKDPGELFDWNRLKDAFSNSKYRFV